MAGACDDKQTKVTDGTKALVDKLKADSQALAAEIQNEAKDIDPDIDTSGPDAWVGADFDVSWKRVEFSLDLPEVTMADQTWSLDLPQVTVKDQEIIFGLPSVRMVPVQTGEYPETTCKMVTKDIGLGVKIDVPECTVTWSPIYVDMPEPYMQEQKIVLGVPEFRMDRTEFVLGVPEFKMVTQTFSLDLPQFTLKNITVEANKAKDKGDALSAEAKVKSNMLKENFKENAKLNLGIDVTALFDCYQADLTKKKDEALAKFQDGINVLQGSIAGMAANKVPDDNETLVKMKQSLAQIVGKRDEFAKTIEEQFIKLGTQQKSFFEKLVGADKQ